MVYSCHHTKANTVHLINYTMQMTLLLVMLFSTLPAYGEDTYPAYLYDYCQFERQDYR